MELFGSELKNMKSCTMVSSSKLFFHVPEQIPKKEIQNLEKLDNYFQFPTFWSSNAKISKKSSSSKTTIISWNLSKIFNFGFDSNSENEKSSANWSVIPKRNNKNGPDLMKQSIISVFRRELGFGQLEGKILTEIVNNSPTETIHFSILDIIPWHFKIFTHTLSVNLKTRSKSEEISLKDLKFLKYSPASRTSQKKNPGILKFGYSLPPNSELHISWEFDKQIFKISDYSPGSFFFTSFSFFFFISYQKKTCKRWKPWI